MQTGGVDIAMLNAHLYLITSFISGCHLVELGRELDLFGKQMIEYKQMVPSKLTLVLRWLVSNLVSSKDSLSLITDQKKVQENLLEQAIKENDYTFIIHIYEFVVIEACIFGRYELAVDMIIKRQEVEKKLSYRIFYHGLTDFFDGLTFLAMAHKTNDVKWGSFASKAIENMKSFVRSGSVNCEHKLLLLEAEAKSLLWDAEKASSSYISAIVAAEKHCFIHDHAIANERAGDFFLRNGDPRASKYYGKAHALYLQWGAQRKADDLSRNIPF